MTSLDHDFMKRALELAERGLYTTDPNPRVGCVIVKDGKIIGEGWHVRTGEAHAEINALKNASADVKGATCYVTYEPCSHLLKKTPPCCDALIAADIRRVVVAMQDPNPQVNGQGIARLRAAGMQVDVGLFPDEAAALNPGFIKRMQYGMPYLRAKMAISLDGRTALSNGVSQWITCGAAQEDSHRLRARASAILTGVQTILDDDPHLNVRLPNIERQPLRVIADTNLRTPAQARCLQIPGKVLIATCVNDQTKYAPLEKTGAEIVLLPKKNGKVDLKTLLRELAIRQCNEIHLEAGPMLLGALLQEQLADELVIYAAPKLLGDKARPLAFLPEFTKLEDAINLKIVGIEMMDKDVKIITKVN